MKSNLVELGEGDVFVVELVCEIQLRIGQRVDHLLLFLDDLGRLIFSCNLPGKDRQRHTSNEFVVDVHDVSFRRGLIMGLVFHAKKYRPCKLRGRVEDC